MTCLVKRELRLDLSFRVEACASLVTAGQQEQGGIRAPLGELLDYVLATGGLRTRGLSPARYLAQSAEGHAEFGRHGTGYGNRVGGSDSGAQGPWPTTSITTRRKRTKARTE